MTFAFNLLSDSATVSTMFIYRDVPISILVGLIASIRWSKLFHIEGDKLVVRTIWGSERISIPSSHYRLHRNRLQLCNSDNSQCITLMPYPRERTRRVLEKLHRHLGLPAKADASFGTTEASKHKQEIVLVACVFFAALLWLVWVSQSTCDPSSDCSALGVLSNLFNGFREIVGGFIDLFWIALGREP